MSADIVPLLEAHGREVGRVDDTSYLLLRAVYACQDDHAPVLYCLESAWPTTLAARMASLIRANDVLAARVVELEQQLAHRPPPNERPPLSGGAVKRAPCDHCGKRIWPDLMGKHIAERHPARPAAPPPPPVALTPEPPWRCAQCHTDTHARSLKDPSRCIRCMVKVEDAGTNGRTVAA